MGNPQFRSRDGNSGKNGQKTALAPQFPRGPLNDGIARADNALMAAYGSGDPTRVACAREKMAYLLNEQEAERLAVQSVREPPKHVGETRVVPLMIPKPEPIKP